jgi:methyl-accepting chemotaxis protein
MASDTKETRTKFGIFQKMLIAMLVVALTPLCAIWAINYYFSIQEISVSVDQRLSAVSDRLASGVDAWVTMNWKALRQNAVTADIQSMSAERQNPVLRSILGEFKWSYLVFTTAANGMNIGRSDDNKPVDYSDRRYYKTAIGGAPMATEVLIGRTTGKPALILAVPIPGGADAKPHGVIAMAMHLTELDEQITNVRIGKSGFAFLLDEGGLVVAHPNEEMAKKRTDLSKHPAFVNRPAEGKKPLVYEDQGRRVLAYVQKTPQGWFMVAQQDHEEAYAPVRDANLRALIILGVTLVLVILVSYLFSQRLAGPIRKLTIVADQISLGKTGVKVEGKERRDEIGSLARAIDRLGTSVRLAIQRLKAKT